MRSSKTFFLFIFRWGALKWCCDIPEIRYQLWKESSFLWQRRNQVHVLTDNCARSIFILTLHKPHHIYIYNIHCMQYSMILLPWVLQYKVWLYFHGFLHDDVIKWKHFPRYWPFLRGIHRSPVNSPHKGQWRGALMFTLICVWINGWVNNREVGDLRRLRAIMTSP